MSALTREPTVTISPFRINKAILHSRKRSHHPHSFDSVNMNTHLLAIFFHFLPVFGYFSLRLGELCPGKRQTSGWLFQHVNAVFDGANVVAETAADTVCFAHDQAGTRVHGFF